MEKRSSLILLPTAEEAEQAVVAEAPVDVAAVAVVVQEVLHPHRVQRLSR